MLHSLCRLLYYSLGDLLTVAISLPYEIRLTSLLSYVPFSNHTQRVSHCP